MCMYAMFVYKEWKLLVEWTQNYRAKSGIFGQSVKFGQRPCLFQYFKYWNKNTLTKQTVKILMRRLKEPSHLDLHCL